MSAAKDAAMEEELHDVTPFMPLTVLKKEGVCTDAGAGSRVSGFPFRSLST